MRLDRLRASSLIPGFDAPSQIPTATLKAGLVTLHRRIRDHDWLLSNADHLARILSGALNRDEFYLDAVETLITIGPYMLTHHKVGRWAELLCEALHGAYTIRDATVQARLYALMGQSYTLQGDISPARTVYDIIIDHAREDDLPPLLADELTLIAHIGLFKTHTYLYTDEFKPELVAHVRALAQRVDEHVLTANLYVALAGVYAHRAETSLALGYGMTALAYWYRRADDLEISKTAQVLATAYSRSNLLPQAAQVAQVAYAHVVKANNDQVAATIAFELGIIADQQQQWEQANAWLDSAYERFVALGWQKQIALVCRSQALTLIPQRRFDEAKAKLDYADLIWERETNWYERAGILATRGYLEAERDRLDAALDYYRQALDLCARVPDMPARDLLADSILDDIERYTGAHPAQS